MSRLSLLVCWQLAARRVMPPFPSGQGRTRSRSRFPATGLGTTRDRRESGPCAQLHTARLRAELVRQ